MNMEAVPEPFDPQDVTEEVGKLTKDLDELDTDPVVRPLHDFMQDKMMPMIATLQREISTLTFYLAAHEDRIVDIEEREESQLLPEDAEALLRYIEKSIEIFSHLAGKENLDLPGMDALIESGKELVSFVNQITLPDDDDDDDDDSPMN